MSTVISLGSINADFQVRVEHRPGVSETLEASDFRRFSGGKAANVSYLAANLGVQTVLLGHVGDDDLAEQALSSLRTKGINLDGVRKIAGESTGVSMITVPPDGKKGIVLANNANHAWSQEDAARCVKIIENVERSAVLAVDCEIPVFVVEQCCRAAHEAGLPVVLDPSPANKVTRTLLKFADYVTPNSVESGILVEKKFESGKDLNSDQLLEAGRELLAIGADTACMKLSDGGCILLNKNRCFHILPRDVTVVDTTGAGDAFAGALAVALVEGKSALDATIFAVAASHLVVTEYGSQTAIPDREEIERFSQQLHIEEG